MTHRTDTDDIIQDLRELVDEMQSEAEEYINSPHDTDRASARQQRYDAEKLRRVLDHYSESDADQEGSEEYEDRGTFTLKDTEFYTGDEE